MIKQIKKGNVLFFYKSRQWLSMRLQILIRDNHECQDCKDDGGVSLADCVHHIIHLKDNPLLALDPDNLRSLCNACHNVAHPEKAFEKKDKKIISIERWE